MTERAGVRRGPPGGFTLLELLLVMAIVAALTAVVLPSAQPTIVEQLRATAQIVATDLAYARSLAVANNSNYKITFDVSGNQYTLTYSGTSPSLKQLPNTPFSSPGDTSEKHIVNLRELPGADVRLAGVAASDSLQPVDNIEFGPLGQTIRTEATTVWLAAGAGDRMRYIAVEVNPATGIARAGDCTTVGPTSGMMTGP
ncbi:MAG: prepilin-type N-terminal cleavage/methylation domain-containing protein [Thermoguttaceae bacterium]